MHLDYSEIKQFSNCKRQWFFGGRNGKNLTTDDKSPALEFGSQFHEHLAQMYRQQSPTELKDVGDKLLKYLLEQYAEEILPIDLKLFDILAVEQYFAIPMRQMFGHLAPDGTFQGVIDLVVRNRLTRNMWVIEHKTAHPRYPRKDPDIQNDLQCQTYYCAASILYPKETIEGVILSEVLKDDSEFQHQRIVLRYTKSDMAKYRKRMRDYIDDMAKQKQIPGTHDVEPATCRMCAFTDLCKEVLLEDDPLKLTPILEGFPQFHLRERYHLEVAK